LKPTGRPDKNLIRLKEEGMAMIQQSVTNSTLSQNFQLSYEKIQAQTLPVQKDNLYGLTRRFQK
jgi:hypothetical protein